MSKQNVPLTFYMRGTDLLLSFLYFQFVALYDKINLVSFLFPAMVALYDHIIRVSPAPSLYSLSHSVSTAHESFFKLSKGLAGPKATQALFKSTRGTHPVLLLYDSQHYL